MDKKLITKMMVLALISIFVGVVICLTDAGIKYFKAGGSEKEQIESFQIKYKNMEEENGIYKLSKKNGKATIDLSGKYVNKFQYSYATDGFSVCTIKVYEYDAYGNTKAIETNDRILRDMSRSVVNLNNKIDKIEIQFKDVQANIEISNFIIDNSFKPNPFILLFVFIGGFTVLCLFFFRKQFAKHIAIATTFSVVMAGTLLLILQPPCFYSWDEQIHMKKAYCMGVAQKGENLPESVVYLYDNVQALGTDSMEERLDMMRLLEIKDKIQSQQLSDFSYQLYSVGYAFQAFAFKICELIGVPFYISMLCARATNLLLYAIAMGAAVYFIPRGKRLLAVFSLLPTSMFLSTAFTYDVMVTAFLVLGTAIIVRQLWVKGEIFSVKRQCLFIICIIIGCMPKAVYVPLLLLGFLVPKKKFATSRNALIFRGSIILCFLGLLSTFVLPTLIAPSVEGDVRGGDTSVSRQLKLILTHPVAYAQILFTNIKNSLVEFEIIRTAIGVFAYFGRSSWWILNTILLSVVTVTDTYKEGEKLGNISWKQRIITWGSIGAVIVLIWTALYLSFTEVGELLIAGVQGRYYLPFLFVFLLMFQSDKIVNKFKVYNYQCSVMLLSILLLLSATYELILKITCL